MQLCSERESATVKSGHKLEAPREETRKKMKPIKREEFTELVEKAIRTPSKKSAKGLPEKA
jgi:hypothetical protein